MFSIKRKIQDFLNGYLIKEEQMSIEDQINQAITSAIENLELVIDLDEDGDLKVQLWSGGRSITSSYVDMCDIKNQLESMG